MWSKQYPISKVASIFVSKESHCTPPSSILKVRIFSLAQLSFQPGCISPHLPHYISLTHEIIPLMLLHPLPTPQPLRSLLPKLLHPRLQLRLHQIKVIHRPNPRYQFIRESTAYSVHQGPADAAEVVCHCISCRDGVRLRVFGEELLAAGVRGGGSGDDEVGGEHRRGDFVAVRAVADEGVD